MKNRSAQILDHISKISPSAECDDCLAKTLEFPQRQSVYQHGTRLAIAGKVERFKRQCHLCGSEKISTSMSHSGNPRSVEKRSSNEHQEPEIQKLLGLNSLKTVGFSKVGLWVMDEDRLSLQLLKQADMKPALYAFVAKSHVLYVGKTSRQLSRRLYHYSRPGPTQSTNIRINALLIEALSNNTLLEIFAFGDVDESRMGPFIYDFPAALETDIIRKLQPKWNKRR